MRPVLVEDRGAVLVELALVVPVVVAVLLGAFELSLAWRDTQLAQDAAASGARAAALHTGRNRHPATPSGAATVSTAVVAATIRDALAGVDPSRLDYVAVFGPDGPVGTPVVDRMPAGCRAGQGSPACVPIPAAVVATTPGPACRHCGLAVVEGGNGSVGVYVRMRGSSPLWGARTVESVAEAPVEGRRGSG